MPPTRHRGAAAPDADALASLSSDAPRLVRRSDVDPVLGASTKPAEPKPPVEVTPAKVAPVQTEVAKTGSGTIKFGAYIDAAVAEKVRDAVVALGGIAIGSLMQEALVREVDRLAKKHNGGEPFPARGVPLRTGRRVG